MSARSGEKRLLIVDEDAESRMTLGNELRLEGYEVEFALDEHSGLDKIITSSFDLIILDFMFPKRGGLDLCVAARREGIATPIVFLSARSETVDRIIGFKLGADAYLSKPVDSMELVARVEALLRWPRPRTGHAERSSNHVQFESFTLDLRRGCIVQNGTVINLTTKEFQLLRYLTEHPGMTISRQEFLTGVWDHKPGTVTRTVDIHIASLRQKLEHDPKKPRMIETVPQLGYRFAAQVKLWDA